MHRDMQPRNHESGLARMGELRWIDRMDRRGSIVPERATALARKCAKPLMISRRPACCSYMWVCKPIVPSLQLW
jgi:hypothetical protein